MRTFLLILFLFLLSGLILFAQEDDGEGPPVYDSEWVDFVSAPYSRGDKNFIITLGFLFPTYFSGIESNRHGLSIGGTGSLAFNYFLTSSFFVGAELAGMFSSSRRGNMLYMVPFGVRIGYQFWYRRFEFPVSLLVGAAPQRYLEKGYFGLIVKPGASVFWRFTPEWSFGLNGNWWLVPQWPENGYNSYGNFLELTLSARYQF